MRSHGWRLIQYSANQYLPRSMAAGSLSRVWWTANPNSSYAEVGGCLERLLDSLSEQPSEVRTTWAELRGRYEGQVQLQMARKQEHAVGDPLSLTTKRKRSQTAHLRRCVRPNSHRSNEAQVNW